MTDPKIPADRLEFRIGEWTVRPSLNRIDRNGLSVDLEPKLMDLLVCLAEHAGEVVSKDALLDDVWKVEHVSDGTLSHAVADLRRALDDDARQPRYIETIRKRGYRLVAEMGPGGKSKSRRPGRSFSVVILVALVVLLAAAGIWVATHRGGDGSSTPPRIVVLPFESLGGQADDSFAPGLTDEIISRLAAVRGLQVVSRTTAFNYDAAGKSARDIGEDLGVGYILEGAVRWSAHESPPTVRITPQLIQVEDDVHLWSGRFDRHPEGILDVQAEIAQQIVAHLDLRLAQEETRVVTTPPTDDPVAYRAFLEALERRESMDSRDIQTAVQMYQRAVEADPLFVQAWAGLAEANGAMHHLGYDLSPARCQTARDALDRALELAPTAPETMRASAFFEYHCRDDISAARSAFEETIRAWPGDAVAMKGMAYVCRRMGDVDDAEQWFRRALDLDPRNPSIGWNLGATVVLDHRYDEGLALVERSIELGPHLRFAYFAKCVALWLGWGDTGQAAEVLERVPGSRDATWYEFAYQNACYSGDYRAASRYAQDSPPGHMLPFESCLAARLNSAPGAGEICSEAVSHYRAVRDRQPELLWPRLLLARTCSVSELHEEALAESEAAVALCPVESDAVSHADALLVKALVLGRAGRTEEAVAIVEQLLEIPSYLSPARLRIDPELASVRHHPKIETIIQAGTPLRIDHDAPADDGDRTSVASVTE